MKLSTRRKSSRRAAKKGGFQPIFKRFKKYANKKRLTAVTDRDTSSSHHDSPHPIFPFFPIFPIFRDIALYPHYPELRERLDLHDGFLQTEVLRSISGYYVNQSHNCCADMRPELPRDDLDLTRAKKEELWKMYRRVAPSVVSVTSFIGVERKIECSGFIVAWSPSDNEATILSSAKVLWSPKYPPPSEFHIIVRMADGTLFLAREHHVDYYLNVVTLKIHSNVEVEAVNLLNTEVVEEMDVYAVGRFFCPHSLCDFSTPGKLYFDQPCFGCNELLKSTCRAYKVCEGGPLITNDGNVIGIGFHDNVSCIHLLPSTVIGRYLRLQESSFGIVRPWFGMTVLDAAQYRPREREHQSPESIVVVDKAPRGFVAEKNGVRPGDLVVSLNGIDIHSLKEVLRSYNK